MTVWKITVHRWDCPHLFCDATCRQAERRTGVYRDPKEAVRVLGVSDE